MKTDPETQDLDQLEFNRLIEQIRKATNALPPEVTLGSTMELIHKQSRAPTDVRDNQ